QKDLTMMSTDTTIPGTLVVTWNWDVLGVAGANTLDACALFDTDGDGLANYSLCGTAAGSPATDIVETLYSCNDANADRCSGNAVIPPPPPTPTCTIAAVGDDPFAAGALFPLDAKATCTIILADLAPGLTPILIDVCSYPSAQPN